MLRVRWKSGVLIVLTFIGAAIAQTGGLDRLHDSATFRSKADMVLINAIVLDRQNRPVRGLTQSNFRLLDEKAEQQIRYFGEEDRPVSLVIVFDASGSMGFQLSRSREAVARVLSHPQADDEFALITFSDRPTLETSWTDNPAEVQNRLIGFDAHGRTPLLDAIQLGLKQFASARNPRHALLIFSDGGDNRSSLKEHDLARILEETDAQVYAFDVADPADAGIKLPEEETGGNLLDRLSERAGGRYFQVHTAKDIAAAADQASKEIRSQYVLGYKPESGHDDGRFHHVQLKLLPPAGSQHLSVYWRRGYRTPSD